MSDHIATHAVQILAYLKAGNTITSLEALKLFNSLRLAAVIFNLRKSNHITTTMITTHTGKRIARYHLPAGV